MRKGAPLRYNSITYTLVIITIGLSISMPTTCNVPGQGLCEGNNILWHFSVSRYVSTYKSHETTMENLAKTRPGALQRLLRDTYNGAK